MVSRVDPIRAARVPFGALGVARVPLTTVVIPWQVPGQVVGGGGVVDELGGGLDGGGDDGCVGWVG
jgi:hypothetical protein